MFTDIMKLIQDFIAVGPATNVHISVQHPNGTQREMILPIAVTVPEVSEGTPLAGESLRDRVARIIASSTIENDKDLTWWKEVQLKLGADGKGENQILPSDTVEQALEKLASIGITG